MEITSLGMSTTRSKPGVRARVGGLPWAVTRCARYADAPDLFPVYLSKTETETRRPPFSKHSTDSSAPINSSTSDYTMTTSLNGSADCLPLPDQAESSAAAAEPPPQPFAGGSTATQHLPTMPVTRPLSPTCTSVTTETSESVRDGERGPASDSGSGTGSGSTSELESMAELEVIIEALKSKDRLFVLKLGEQMDGLIRDRG